MKNNSMEAEIKVVLLIATAEEETTFGSIELITDKRTMLVDKVNSGKNECMGTNDSSVINEEKGEGEEELL
jgi:hypothetical protein